MKNLLKFSFVLAFVATTCISNAQSNKLKFGVKAGLNLSNIAQDFKDSEDEDDTKTLTGLAFGVTAEYELKENLAFQSGLMFSRKGYKMEGSDEGEKYEDKYKISWLEVPMNFVYKMNDFQVYAGPYMAFGLSGKWESEYTYDGETESYDGDIDFGNDSSEEKDDEGMVRGLDYGLNLGLGYQTGNLLFNAGYSFGLANLTPDYKGEGSNFDPKDMKVSNRVLTFSVSYFFGK